jgi:hypothetical protein
MRLGRLSAILYKKWEPCTYHIDIIIGWWAEGWDSTYKIQVPYQLREPIIEMQNWLCDKYIMFQELKNKSNKISRWFEE